MICLFAEGKELSCPSDGKCLDSSKVCDKAKDCAKNEDETFFAFCPPKGTYLHLFRNK